METVFSLKQEHSLSALHYITYFGLVPFISVGLVMPGWVKPCCNVKEDQNKCTAADSC